MTLYDFMNLGMLNVAVSLQNAGLSVLTWRRGQPKFAVLQFVLWTTAAFAPQPYKVVLSSLGLLSFIVPYVYWMRWIDRSM